MISVLLPLQILLIYKTKSGLTADWWQLTGRSFCPCSLLDTDHMFVVCHDQENMSQKTCIHHLPDHRVMAEKRNKFTLGHNRMATIQSSMQYKRCIGHSQHGCDTVHWPWVTLSVCLTRPTDQINALPLSAMDYAKVIRCCMSHQVTR